MANEPGRQRVIDWERIEGEYRAGVYSVREIAKRHGLSHVAIGKHVKKHQWQRDLTAKVRERVRVQLVTSEIPVAPVTDDSRATKVLVTDEEIVEAAADTVVQVVKLHRKDVAYGRQVVETLFGQLNVSASNREGMQQEIIAETQGDAGNSRRIQMFKAVSLPTHAAIARDLSLALKHVICLERQAFSLDERATDGDEETNAAITNKISAAILVKLNNLANEPAG